MNYISKILSQKNLLRAFEAYGEMSIGWFFILVAIGLCVVFIIVLLKWFLFRKITQFSNIIASIFLIMYLAVIFQLTLFSRENGSRIGIKLKPFSEVVGNDEFHWLMMSYAVLNVLLFVPYGVVVSLFSWIKNEKTNKCILWSALISFLTSIVIETTQLITERGFYEVEDLICNTLGGVVGTLCFLFGRVTITKLKK